MNALSELDGLQVESGIRIFDGNKSPSGPIPSAESFFQRIGLRRLVGVDSVSKPYLPSRSIGIKLDGSIVLNSPKYLR